MAKWDPTVVLDMIEKWVPHQEICLKKLSFKLAFLLALTTGQRVQALNSIKIKNINIVNKKCYIIIDKLLKSSRRGTHQLPLELNEFTNMNLCVIDVLKYYLIKTLEIRNGDFLFISFQKPHKEISTETLSRWIKNVLKEAGIDATAHSTRSLSTSVAADNGIPINQVLDCAGWAHESTFKNFYRLKSTENFGNKVITAIQEKVNY